MKICKFLKIQLDNLVDLEKCVFNCENRRRCSRKNAEKMPKNARQPLPERAGRSRRWRSRASRARAPAARISAILRPFLGHFFGCIDADSCN